MSDIKHDMIVISIAFVFVSLLLLGAHFLPGLRWVFLTLLVVWLGYGLWNNLRKRRGQSG